MVSVADVVDFAFAAYLVGCVISSCTFALPLWERVDHQESRLVLLIGTYALCIILWPWAVYLVITHLMRHANEREPE